MLQNYVSVDITKTLKELTSLTENHFPYVLSKTLTQLAKGAQAAIRSDMPNRFNIRSRWEIQGVRFEPARKADVRSTGSAEAIVKHLDSYMTRQETGGIKKGRRSIGIPQRDLEQMNPRTGSGAVQKRYLPKNLLADEGKTRGRHRKGRHAKPKPFLMKYHGAAVIAVRPGNARGPLKILYRLEPRVKIKPRFEFQKQVDRHVQKEYEKLFAANMAAALKDVRK
jgi:hypothetical protein